MRSDWPKGPLVCMVVAPLAHIAGFDLHSYQIPSRKAGSRSSTQLALKPWSVIVLEVNEFTILEWPSFRQRPYADFSAGEELSESHVVSCSWSVPGLAQHDRCILGILTANGLYSLWDANGDLSFNTSWKRIRVLNRLLELYFASQDPECSVVSAGRYRIRAAAWAKRSKPSDQQNSFHKGFGLALLNDKGEIIFLTIDHAENKQPSQASYRVVHVLDLNCEVDPYPDGLLDQLRWLNSEKEDEHTNAVLLCSTEGRTWTIHAQIEHTSAGSVDMVCSFPTPVPRKLTTWNTSEAEIATLDSPYLNYQQRQLQKNWEKSQAEGYPGFTRYYGLAAYKDFQALHISFHPRTVIEYHIQVQEFSYILFSHSSLRKSGASADEIKFDWEISAPILSDNDSSARPWRMMLSELSGLALEELLQDDLWTTYSKTIRSWLMIAFLRGWQLAEASDLLKKLSGQSVEREILDMIDEYREESSSIEALQQIERIMDPLFKSSESWEICSICGEQLKWHNEQAAQCQQGHVFGKSYPHCGSQDTLTRFIDRCSLTLLAIQKPGISKFCASCNREYIDKNHILRDDEPLSDSTCQQMVSTLFKTFPRCIYCEGTLLNFS